MKTPSPHSPEGPRSSGVVLPGRTEAAAGLICWALQLLRGVSGQFWGCGEPGLSQPAVLCVCPSPRCSGFVTGPIEGPGPGRGLRLPPVTPRGEQGRAGGRQRGEGGFGERTRTCHPAHLGPQPAVTREASGGAFSPRCNRGIKRGSEKPLDGGAGYISEGRGGPAPLQGGNLGPAAPNRPTGRAAPAGSTWGG